MTIEGALELLRGAFMMAAEVGGPLLFAALFMGLFVGAIQTATQLNEQSVSFVAKVLAVGVALMIAGPYIVGELVAYTRRTIQASAEIGR